MNRDAIVRVRIQRTVHTHRVASASKTAPGHLAHLSYTGVLSLPNRMAANRRLFAGLQSKFSVCFSVSSFDVLPPVSIFVDFRRFRAALRSIIAAINGHTCVQALSAVEFSRMSFIHTTRCLKRNVPPLTCYNFDIHHPIMIICGSSVTEKVRNPTTLCFPTSPI